MSGYTRQSAANMTPGDVIFASDLNSEFNALQSAFDGATGHSHDGSVGNGPKIDLSTSVTGILPVINGGINGINKVDATTAPTTSDDSNDGYAVGSFWIDVTNDIYYVALDVTPGAAVWRRFQSFSAALSSIAGLTTVADRLIYTTAPDVYATTALTPFARSILDDADATTVRSTLGLGSLATQNSNTVSISGGTISGVSISSGTISGGTISGITDLSISDGGTGASTAAGARTNLGVVIGTDVQAFDSGLQSIAGLTTSADEMLYTTGSDTYATTPLTPFARTILDDSDASSVRNTIGAQQSDATLTALSFYNTNGIVTQTATDTFTGRSITGTSNEITVTNGDGISGNPIISIPSNVTFTGKTITGGTLSSPTLILKQSSSPNPTVEGDIQWNTVDNSIVVGDGSGQKIFYSNGWELIGTYVFNGSSGSYEWQNLSPYRSLEVRGFALPGTDGVAFRLRSSTNNGVSYDSGASDYGAQRIYQTGGTVNGQANFFDRFPVHMGVTVGNAANEGIKFNAEFEEFNQSSHLRYTCHSFYLDTAGSYTQEILDGKRESTTARNALEFSVSSGVISSGRITLWGFR